MFESNTEENNTIFSEKLTLIRGVDKMQVLTAKQQLVNMSFVDPFCQLAKLKLQQQGNEPRSQNNDILHIMHRSPYNRGILLAFSTD